MIDLLTGTIDVPNLHKLVINYLIIHAIVDILFFSGRKTVRIAKAVLVKTEQEAALWSHYSAHPFKRKG